MNRILQISNILALVVTIVMNYLSNTGVFNENTMASVSAAYQNYFTPAGYAFSIWGLIYLALLAFIIHQSKGLFSKKEVPAVVGQIGWLFVISCVANCLWILAWLYEYTGTSILIMVILLWSLLRIMVKTRMELDLISFGKIALECWPFAIYLGWITVALIADVAAYLTKIQWDGFGLSDVTWTIIMIAVATFVHLYLTWTRNLRESASVAAWAFIAIAVANWSGVQMIAYAALAGAAIVLISTGIHGYQNRNQPFILRSKLINKG